MNEDEGRHPETEKLRRNLAGFCDAAEAADIVDDVPLSSAATDGEKAAWVRHIVDALDRRFNPSTIQAIRRGCHCDEAGRLGEMKAWLGGLYRSSVNLEEFVAKVNEHGAGWHLEGGSIHTKFLACECYMLRDVERLPSDTWCQCTVGYTQNLFRHIFGCAVESELLQSIKRGHACCVVKITPRFDRPSAVAMRATE